MMVRRSRVFPNTRRIPQSVGEWLSLVEHLVRDQGVGGSNPLSPTNLLKQMRAQQTDHLELHQVLSLGSRANAGFLQYITI